jgi:hypothetical protein
MIHSGIVIVEKCSFAVADMKIAGRFWRETSDYFTFNCILKDASIGSVLFLEIEGRRKDLSFDEV